MKHLKNIFISAAILLCTLLIPASAYAYTYSYDPESGFDVPYSVVTQGTLEEPASVVGEVRETAPDSGVLTLTLPSGNRIEYALPTLGKFWSGSREDGEYVYTVIGKQWDVYDINGNPVDADYAHTKKLLPLYYKGSLFSYDQSNIFKLDLNTFEKQEQYRGGQLINGLDLEHKTLYEYPLRDKFGGGYEITAGNFVFDNSLEYEYLTENESDFMRFESQGYFRYSCDGVRFIKVRCPVSAQKITHYTVNGTDSIALKCVDENNITYAAYSIEDLQEIWDEYCAPSPYVYINGVRLGFEQQPVIIDGTTFMPVRFLLETAGAEVTWDEDTLSAHITYANKNVVITNNTTTAYIDNIPTELTSPARIINGKMMIPLRFISESLGFDVEWDQETMSVNVDVPVDDINRYVPLFPLMETPQITININGKYPIDCLSCNGRTLLSLAVLNNFFYIEDTENDIKINTQEDAVKILSTNEAHEYELELKDPADFNTWNLKDTYAPVSNSSPGGSSAKIYRAFNAVKKIQFKNNAAPVYFIGETPESTDSVWLLNYYVCIEECADRLDKLHYEWIAEENTLYVYISDDMVTYDDALKSILDKKGIECSDTYTGDCYKDLEAMQKYSDNDLSSLVSAGIKAGLIRESDCVDGHLRPTRNISHIDLKRMLSGIGYDYTYSDESTNKPVTQAEFKKVLGDL